MRMLLFLLTSLAPAASACDRKAGPDAGGGAAGKAAESWIRGGVDERFAQVAKHLRGFDVAMVETGYRHGELYRAGRERSWDYARYQLEKIETAVANGIERRPRRAASAAMLAPAIAHVRSTVDRRDEAGFAEAFAALTQTCNACHVAEQVPFIRIAVPSGHAPPAGAVPTAPCGEGTP